MYRATRSRRTAALSVDSSTKTNDLPVKRTANNKSSKSTSRNGIIQTENVLLTEKQNEESSVRNTRSKIISKSKSLSKKKHPIVNKSTILAKRSPILQDRTNSNTKLYKHDIIPVKTNNVPVHDSTMNDKQCKSLSIIIDKYINQHDIKVVERRSKKASNIQKVNSMKSNLNKMKVSSTLSKTSDEEDKNKAKDVGSNIEKNNEPKTLIVPGNSKKNFQSINTRSTRTLRSKQISMEEVQKLLNDDEEIVHLDSNKTNNKKQKPVKNNLNNNKPTIIDKVNEPMKKDLEAEIIEKVQNVPGIQTNSKKFFKNRQIATDIKETISSKKNLRQQTNKRKNVKKVIDNDDTFTLAPLRQTKSIRPLGTKLRPRVNKNYCEILISESPDSNEKELTNIEKTVEENSKKTEPIYKSVKELQENIQDKEKIYNFPDDSQDNGKKIKKRKKNIKKAVVKRVKKLTPQKLLTKGKQKKNTNKAQPIRQLKEQNSNTTTNKQDIPDCKIPTSLEEKNISVNRNKQNIPAYKIPTYLEDAGDSTIQEVSTIKILSDQKLEESQRIDLTVTPCIPKTMSSELKLFSAKNAINSQSTAGYSNMVNHSLIRKSMSPIKKLIDNFDAGSPWRPIDTFSRVQQVVQSTPQINRQSSVRDKKLLMSKMNLNKKSISSDETIHILSNIRNPLKKIDKAKVASMLKNEVSPRKFGTVISNLSSMQPKNVQNVNSQSPVKNNQKSPIKEMPLFTTLKDDNKQFSSQIGSPQTNIADIPANQDEILNEKAKENLSPNKCKKKKFSTPSPFRFDRIYSKKTVSTESQHKQQKSSEKRNEAIELHAMALHEGNTKSSILRQSTLNNFLNLDQMPQETCISTMHGIFSDVHSTPIQGRKPKNIIQEPNIENAFGFDDADASEISPVKSATAAVIDTKQNIKHGEKDITKARDKLIILPTISEKLLKKPILKSALKKKAQESTLNSYTLKDKNVDEAKSNEIIEKLVNNDKSQSASKSILDSISFSDTFDLRESEIKLPETVPLFIDLQPAHFSTPPRHSYQKRKREVAFDSYMNDIIENNEEVSDKPQPKKKKVPKIVKEGKKKMNEWIKNINETFDEIDHFDLIVE